MGFYLKTLPSMWLRPMSLLVRLSIQLVQLSQTSIFSSRVQMCRQSSIFYIFHFSRSSLTSLIWNSVLLGGQKYSFLGSLLLLDFSLSLSQIYSFFLEMKGDSSYDLLEGDSPQTLLLSWFFKKLICFSLAFNYFFNDLSASALCSLISNSLFFCIRIQFSAESLLISLSKCLRLGVDLSTLLALSSIEKLSLISSDDELSEEEALSTWFLQHLPQLSSDSSEDLWQGVGQKDCMGVTYILQYKQ